jgi:hypothetical protein
MYFRQHLFLGRKAPGDWRSPRRFAFFYTLRRITERRLCPAIVSYGQSTLAFWSAAVLCRFCTEIDFHLLCPHHFLGEKPQETGAIHDASRLFSAHNRKMHYAENEFFVIFWNFLASD